MINLGPLTVKKNEPPAGGSRRFYVCNPGTVKETNQYGEN
jgi:hypothetical protein